MGRRLLIILGIVGLAEYYSFIVVRSALRNLPAPWRTGITILYLLLTIGSWLGLVFFRQINWANVPHLLRNIYIAFVLGFVVGKVLILLVMLIDDLRRLLLWVITLFQPAAAAPVAGGATNGISRSAFLSSLALILGGTTLAGFIYGISNRYNYHIRKVKMKFASLPASFKGLKIVQISDIHTGSFDNHEAVEHGIQKILAEKPDIIFFTGDLVNNIADEVDARYQEIFSRLRAPMGVYSTLGNHDYGEYVQWPSAEAKVQNLEKLKALHAAMGWRLMMNEHILLEKGGDKIAIIGIENWSAKANFPKYGDMRKAYNGLSGQNAPFKILLSHDPSHWDAQVRPEYPDVNLTLSGHTHGMQFGIDTKWLKWSPVQYMYKEWAGLYKEGEQYLYVNRGFGFLGYPGRLGILPEITVFEFTQA
jgi:predicted MPP superfamily phosphohydrolase